LANDFQRSLRFFRPDGARITLVSALLLAGVGLNLLKPWPLALLVDCVLGGQPLPPWLPLTNATRPELILALSLATLFFHVLQGAVSNGPLTLVALLTIPLVVTAIRFFGRKMTERGLQAQQADSAVRMTVHNTTVLNRRRRKIAALEGAAGVVALLGSDIVQNLAAAADKCRAAFAGQCLLG